MKIRDESSKLEITDQGVDFVKGEEIGWFEMGSTIVLVFEGPEDTQLHVEEGMRLWLGQEIVTIPATSSSSKLSRGDSTNEDDSKSEWMEWGKKQESINKWNSIL